MSQKIVKRGLMMLLVLFCVSLSCFADEPTEGGKLPDEPSIAPPPYLFVEQLSSSVMFYTDVSDNIETVKVAYTSGGDSETVDVSKFADGKQEIAVASVENLEVTSERVGGDSNSLVLRDFEVVDSAPTDKVSAGMVTRLVIKAPSGSPYTKGVLFTNGDVTHFDAKEETIQGESGLYSFIEISSNGTYLIGFENEKSLGVLKSVDVNYYDDKAPQFENPAWTASVDTSKKDVKQGTPVTITFKVNDESGIDRVNVRNGATGEVKDLTAKPFEVVVKTNAQYLVTAYDKAGKSAHIVCDVSFFESDVDTGNGTGIVDEDKSSSSSNSSSSSKGTDTHSSQNSDSRIDKDRGTIVYGTTDSHRGSNQSTWDKYWADSNRDKSDADSSSRNNTQAKSDKSSSSAEKSKASNSISSDGYKYTYTNSSEFDEEKVNQELDEIYKDFESVSSSEFNDFELPVEKEVSKRGTIPAESEKSKTVVYSIIVAVSVITSGVVVFAIKKPNLFKRKGNKKE